MTNIEKSILTAVALADIFDMPVVADEKFLDVFKGSATLKNKVHLENGFFYLGHEVIERQKMREKIGAEKWNIARKFTKFFRRVPFVREIFISGSLARGNTTENSDIDLLIVAKHGRIWTARMFIYLITFFSGKHRHGKKIKDRFCLNHFISDKNLEIKRQSLYNAETYLHLVPILKEKNIADEFRQANQWIKNYFPYSDGAVSDDAITRKSDIKMRRAGIKKILEFVLGGFVGDVFEWTVKKIQMIKQRRSRKNNIGGHVILSDNELAFHPDSPEGKIMEKFNERMKKLEINQ